MQAVGYNACQAFRFGLRPEMHTPEITSAFQPPGAPFGGCTPISFKDVCYLRKEDKMNRTKHLCVTFVTT